MFIVIFISIYIKNLKIENKLDTELVPRVGNYSLFAFMVRPHSGALAQFYF